MKIVTTIWKDEPYTETVHQVCDGSMKITEVTINKCKPVVCDEDAFKPIKAPKKTRATSGMVVDVSGLEWAVKVNKIKSVLDSEGIKVNDLKFIKSVCRKESVHSPDNLLLLLRLIMKLFMKQMESSRLNVSWKKLKLLLDI